MMPLKQILNARIRIIGGRIIDPCSVITMTAFQTDSAPPTSDTLRGFNVRTNNPQGGITINITKTTHTDGQTDAVDEPDKVST